MGYPGSKAQAGTFQRIIGQMPPHSVYVEPFFGSGQVFWRKKRASTNFIIDADAGVIAKAGAAEGVFAIHGNALEWLPRFITGSLVIQHLSGQKTLPDAALIYCDPPYVLSTRAHRRYYKNEMSDADHSALIATLRTAKCRVMISGYPSELYSSQLHDWRCISYQTRTRGRTLTECLWCNFPEPTELHDWRYAGKNFRERLSLKRLVSRWLARIEAMPATKRGYVLDAIEQRHFQRSGPVTSAMTLSAASAGNDSGDPL